MDVVKREQLLEVDVPLLMVGVPLGLIFALLPVANNYWHSMCPADTSYWNGAPDTAFALLIPLVLFAGIYGRALDRRLKAAQAAADAAHVPTIPLGSIVKWSAAAAAVLCGVGMLASTFNYYCVTPREIMYRANYFATDKTYPWSAVRRVEADCEIVTGRYSLDVHSLIVTMDDGQQFDVAAGGSVASVQTLVTALGTRGFDYDPYVGDSCRPEWRAALLSPALLSHMK